MVGGGEFARTSNEEKSVWVSSSETGPRSTLEGGEEGGVRSEVVEFKERMVCWWRGGIDRERKALYGRYSRFGLTIEWMC